MISIKQALDIRDGDYVYDYYGRHLKVFGYSIVYEKGLPQNIEFSCCDINTNAKFIYQYDELYLNFDDLSDEQKLFLKWLKNQSEYYDDRYETKKLEQAFMSGFSLGHSYKKQKLAEEQLQK
jgi:hypothetical protein